MLNSFADQYKTTATAYGQIVGAYISLIVNKIHFHKNHPEINGDLNLQEYKNKTKLDVKKAAITVTHLLDLQKHCILFQQRTLQTQNLNPCKLSGVLITVKESYSVYNLTVVLMRYLEDKMDIEGFSQLVETFNQQYPIVYKFFFTCASIPYVTQQMSTPTIPRESEFEVKKVPKSSLPQKAPSSKKRVKSHMPQPQPNSEEFMASVQGAGPGTSDEAVVSTQSTGVTTLEKERDIVGASRVIAVETEKLLADVKGLSNRVDDPELKLQLTEGTRNAARMVSKILAETQILSAQGKLTESTLDNLRSCQNVFEQNLAGVRSAIHDQSKSTEVESNLDSLAERELMNAAKIIEDAAASLKVQAALRKSHQEVDGGVVDLGLKGSIAESALFITTSTQRLIMAATAAQQDRVAKGLTSPHDDQMYHSNAMWAEGLISAAKAVANAIKLLVASANKPDGEIDEASLIACTRAVAAHTAKLQSATKAKGEAHSKAVTGVDNAAKQVRDATNALLSEAKTKIGATKSQAEEDISFNSFGTIKAEMELETNIQRLKARIETANQELFSARKRSYEDSRANKGATTEQPRRTASVSQKSNIDTSSLISPFGHTNSPSRHGLERKSATGQVDSPSSLHSFGNKDKVEDEESVVLPAYMTKKLEAVIGGGPKFDLTNKPPLEMKPRPIHLQVDLQANLPPPPTSQSPLGNPFIRK
eukprot:TRINITY_DN5837_c0_g1_i4.p1 TRINITY_DN5837_c0_g1~~TRINITY_DN5837_c0_g1_i4.p1  ORF type:complete len:706 (+),score=178.07 TRINITY_DN5837_c0_g1_i4:382-2499(+)